MLGGNIHFSYMNLSEPYAQLKAGKLRALALAPKRMVEVPNVPTFSELGYPQVDILGWRGVSGPPNMPEGIVKKLDDAFAKAMKEPKFIEGMKELHVPILYRGNKELSNYLAMNYEAFSKFLKEGCSYLFSSSRIDFTSSNTCFLDAPVEASRGVSGSLIVPLGLTAPTRTPSGPESCPVGADRAAPPGPTGRRDQSRPDT
jgi:hypothetical protein